MVEYTCDLGEVGKHQASQQLLGMEEEGTMRCSSSVSASYYNQ